MRWHVLTDDHAPLVGGVATVTSALCAGLRARGDEVQVWTRARRGLPSGVNGVRGRSFGRWSGIYLGAAVWPRLAQGDRVLATTWPVATGLTHLGLRGAELTVLVQGSEVTRGLSPAAHRVFRSAQRRFALSHFLARQLDYPTAVLPAPIDLGPSLPSGTSGDWLVVARLTALKGVDRVIRLAAAAGRRLVVIGEGPERGHLGQLAASLGWAHQVRFVGALPRSATLERIAAAELLWLLPRADSDGGGAEGLGLVLLEAAARGVPVVGCRTGGVPEAVGTGLLLPRPDDVRASLRALRAWQPRAAGAQAQDWLRAHHGTERAVALLRA